ncbi:glycosyltransferase family 2 protein [Chloroflexota bacterium]
MVQTRIIAAIPCYNEDRFIGSVVLKTRKFVDQVIVVDDGSTDETARIAEEAGALVIRHEVNTGKGLAMNTAFQWARESGVHAMVLLDGDGQHEPAYIPDLLKPILENKSDVSLGTRFLDIRSNIPRYRTIGQHTLTFVANIGSGVKLSDNQCGFRAFSRKAIETLSFSQKGLGDVECEMQFLISENSLSVAEVPTIVNYDERAKRNPVAQGMKNLNALVNMIAERRPLFFFGLSGLISVVIGLIVGLRVLYVLSIGGGPAFGSALVAVLLLIIGILSIFTGIILNSIIKRKG